MDDAQKLASLKEVAGIASGNAATALSKLMSHEVTVAVPSVKLVAIEKIVEEVGHGAHVSTTALVRIEGDLKGVLFFTLDPIDAKDVSIDVIDKQTGGSFTDIDQTVLREVVNIVAGAAVTSMSTFLELQITQSVPASATDMLGAVLDPFIAELGAAFDQVLIEQELFTIPAKGASLKLTAIIDPPSTTKILQKIAEKVQL